MKKLFLWTTGILGGLALIFIAIAGYFYLRLTTFGDYPSGGALSSLQSGFDIVFYDIHLTVNPDEESIAGYTTVSFRSVSDTQTVIELDLLDHLDVTSVTDRNGPPPEFTRNGHKLYITGLALKKDSVTSLDIHYRGKPLKAFYPPWKGGFNWSKDEDGLPWTGLSCQGEGAKVWIPCKDHPSDEPDSAGIHISVPEPLFCASNGTLDSAVKHPGNLITYHWRTRYPINNYCLNISIGNYITVRRNYITLDGDTMPVVYYVLPQNRAQADTLIDMAVDMLYTYRKYYGEYPFTREKFGLADNDYLGMEHQTLNAYGNHYAFSNILGHRFDGLMLHEMGHEWWGNKVTANDWADFWIHESFCTYGESLYHLEKTGEPGYHEYFRRIRKQITHKKPILSPPNSTATDAYHTDIYYKGAHILHSLRFITGDSVFFRFLKTLSNDSRFTYQNLINSDDVLSHLNQVSNQDLKPYMNMMLRTTDLPEILIERKSRDEYLVSLTNCNFSLPVEIRTDQGIRRYMIQKEPLRLTSSSIPAADEKNWFMKNTIYPADE